MNELLVNQPTAQSAPTTDTSQPAAPTAHRSRLSTTIQNCHCQTDKNYRFLLSGERKLERAFWVTTIRQQLMARNTKRSTDRREATIVDGNQSIANGAAEPNCNGSVERIKRVLTKNTTIDSSTKRRHIQLRQFCIRALVWMSNPRIQTFDLSFKIPNVSHCKTTNNFHTILDSSKTMVTAKMLQMHHQHFVNGIVTLDLRSPAGQVRVSTVTSAAGSLGRCCQYPNRKS